MKPELLGKGIGNAAEFTGKTARSAKNVLGKHKLEAVIYTVSGLLSIGGLAGTVNSWLNENSSIENVNAGVETAYPGLPSVEEFNRVVQEKDALEQRQIEIMRAELRKGNTVVDFSAITDIQEYQTDLEFVEENQEPISTREQLRQTMFKKEFNKTTKFGLLAILGSLSGSISYLIYNNRKPQNPLPSPELPKPI